MLEHSRWRLLPYLAALAVVAFTYVWTTTSNNLSWNWDREQTDYYNLLVHGFLKGRLSLGVEVRPELLHVPDPDDPAQRPEGTELHEASLYRGRYYIYNGVVPAALLLLRFRLVTGFDLPLPVASLGFALGGSVVALLLLADMRRRYFPRSGPLISLLLAVAFGFVSCAPVLLRRSSMYDLPILSGSCFALAALACFYAALQNERRRLPWLTAASICGGLAIGSRPTYLFALVGMLAAYPLFFRNTSGAPIGRRHAVRVWMAAVIPLAVIGAGLAWYNYARFGRVTEFGLSYILSGVYESKIEHFRLRYAPWNLFTYLFAPGEWGRYFPFYHEVAITLPLPRQHYGMDHPFGLLVNLPFLWLAPFAACGAVERRFRRAFLITAAWTGAVVGALLLCFYAAMARYLGDFAAPFGLVATIGGMAVVERAPAGWRRRMSGTLVAGLALASIFSVFVFSAQLYDRLRQENPSGEAALARVADAPVHWLEAWHGRPVGPIILRVVFPSRAGEAEELVRTGWTDQTDRVLVAYPDPAHVPFEYEHAGAPIVRSEPLLVDRSREHVIRIAMGSLDPAASWSGYDEWTNEQRIRERRWLDVAIDGRPLIESYQRFYPASRGTVVVGGAKDTGSFSGRIVSVAREPLTKPPVTALASPGNQLIAPVGGVWRLAVRFPAGKRGTRDPLIVSGETGRGDFLAVEDLGPGRLRFMLDHWENRPFSVMSGRTNPGARTGLRSRIPTTKTARGKVGENRDR
ncbi:MAG TPA: hypothetical protein VHE61_07025 [Opitutaceae bacterium]|nr:hypothetical protein [Opitutaceae bacterium]